MPSIFEKEEHDLTAAEKNTVLLVKKKIDELYKIVKPHVTVDPKSEAYRTLKEAMQSLIESVTEVPDPKPL